MKSRFTIRPQIKEGESLTSYMLRISKVNSMSLLDAVKVTKLYNNQRPYRCELNLNGSLDIVHVSQYLNATKEQVLGMTFFPLLHKLLAAQYYSSDHLKNYFPKLIETKNRVFCCVCLNKDGYFRLLWQVKGITMCNKHLCELQSYCNFCFKQQPFLSDWLSRLECKYCCSPLHSEKKEVISDLDFISKQTRKYEEWGYMLDPHQEIIPNIPKVVSEKVIAHALLYTAQSPEQEFNKKLIQTKLGNDYVHRVLRFINDNKSSAQYVTFPMLLSGLEKLDVSIMDFTKERISDCFLESIPTGKTERKMVCLTPWCSSFNRNIAMQKIEPPQTSFNNIDYTNRHVCTECFIYYGFTQKTGHWQEIGDSITLITNVRGLFKAGYKREKIQRELNLGYKEVNKAVGYLTQHKLIEPSLYQKYLPEFVPTDLVASFRKIVAQRGEKYRIARKLFGWNSLAYFYYLASPEVQIYLALEGNRKHRYKSKDSTSKHEWEIKVVEEIERFRREEKDISIKYIAKSLKCSAVLLGHYGFRKLIQQAQCEQRNHKRRLQEEAYRQKVDKYLQTCLNEKEEVLTKKIYELVGRTNSYIKDYYPDLCNWISERVRYAKEQQKKEKYLEYQTVAEKTMVKLHKMGSSTSTSNILRTMGINNAQRDYPQLLSFINTIKITHGLV